MRRKATGKRWDYIWPWGWLLFGAFLSTGSSGPVMLLVGLLLMIIHLILVYHVEKEEEARLKARREPEAAGDARDAVPLVTLD